jgi:hypothetical protein
VKNEKFTPHGLKKKDSKRLVFFAILSMDLSSWPACSRRTLVVNSMAIAGAAMSPPPALGADLGALANRSPFYDESLNVFAIIVAQRDVRKLFEDEDTFKTMMRIGIPTGNLQVPPQISFSAFKKLEPRVSDPGAFMDAAIEYVEYSRDANDLVELARLSRTNGAGPAALDDYVDRSLAAARGAAKALDRMVPLLPRAEPESSAR